MSDELDYALTRLYDAQDKVKETALAHTNAVLACEAAHRDLTEACTYVGLVRYAEAYEEEA